MPYELSVEFLKEKQKIKPKTFLVPAINYSICVLFWVGLLIARIPTVGLIFLFFVFVASPFAIIFFITKSKMDDLRRKAKLIDNGVHISEMVLVKKESDTDVNDTTTYRLKFVPPDSDDDAYILSQSVSYKVYQKANVGSRYYAVHFHKDDEFGRKYVFEDVYHASYYGLSEDLRSSFKDYSEICEENSIYNNKRWEDYKQKANKKSAF